MHLFGWTHPKPFAKHNLITTMLNANLSWSYGINYVKHLLVYIFLSLVFYFQCPFLLDFRPWGVACRVYRTLWIVYHVTNVANLLSDKENVSFDYLAFWQQKNAIFLGIVCCFSIRIWIETASVDRAVCFDMVWTLPHFYLFICLFACKTVIKSTNDYIVQKIEWKKIKTKQKPKTKETERDIVSLDDFRHAYYCDGRPWNQLKNY